MVRERVGDWRLAWRFALAGLVAGLLVAALTTRGVMNGPFFAAQDQLFPAPAPDPPGTPLKSQNAAANARSTRGKAAS